ncbi:MAG: hypothetical protein A2Z29_09025 [Chloroflexi bacterium RBG_16_56_11]|nr:MAG: hypothetical protein A2Z29_09025 [Chloroflexi bacterium RBG_16_56_11]
MKKIGILYHPRVEATQRKASEIEGILRARGITAWVCSAWDKTGAAGRLDGTDLLLTVGGDGTVLRAVQIAVPGNIPIAGINLGKLGFMTEMDAGEVPQKLPEIIGASGWIDERSMLQAEATISGRSQTFHALNDIVVARGEIARLIRVEVDIDGERLTTYKADGVIAATATGSTGYALAVGGPILYPQSPDILLVAVAPHLSPGYALVLPETATVTLRLQTYQPGTLSIDGHVNLAIADGDVVTVKRSPHTARFWRVHPRGSFYTSLEEKLRGKHGVPGRKSQNTGHNSNP